MTEIAKLTATWPERWLSRTASMDFGVRFVQEGSVKTNDTTERVENYPKCDACGRRVPLEQTTVVHSQHGDGRFCEECRCLQPGGEGDAGGAGQVIRESPKHVIMRNVPGAYLCECLHCGEKHRLVPPLLLKTFCALAEAFVKVHRKCPNPRGPSVE